MSQVLADDSMARWESCDSENCGDLMGSQALNDVRTHVLEYVGFWYCWRVKCFKINKVFEVRKYSFGDCESIRQKGR